MRFVAALALFFVAMPLAAADVRHDLDVGLSGPSGFLREYKVQFPDRYVLFLDRLARAYDGNRQTATYAGMAESRKFIHENAKNVAAAPSVTLLEYITAQRDLLSYLRTKDVNLCSQLVTGRYVYSATSRSAELTTKLTVTISTLVRAARQGIDHPQPRIYWQLSEADANAYADAMARIGISEKQASMMDSQAAMLAGSPVEQCDTGLLMYRAVSKLAPNVAANVAAFMVYQQSAS